MGEIIQTLQAVIQDRRAHAPEGSYTGSLYAAGLPRIARKVGEEGVETAVAALSEGDDRLIQEMADLVYHCLVLLSARDLDWQDVEAELARRSETHR